MIPTTKSSQFWWKSHDLVAKPVKKNDPEVKPTEKVHDPVGKPTEKRSWPRQNTGQNKSWPIQKTRRKSWPRMPSARPRIPVNIGHSLMTTKMGISEEKNENFPFWKFSHGFVFAHFHSTHNKFHEFGRLCTNVCEILSARIFIRIR